MDAQAAAGLGDQALDHRQAEAGALAHALGGKERLHAAGQHLGGHASAVVGDFQAHVAAGAGTVHRAVDHQVGPRADFQAAAFAHGVAGVHREVEDGQFELVRIHHHRRQAFRDLDADLDGRAERALDQVVHAFDQLAQGHCLRLEGLPAGEGEQATDEVPRPFGGL